MYNDFDRTKRARNSQTFLPISFSPLLPLSPATFTKPSLRPYPRAYP